MNKRQKREYWMGAISRLIAEATDKGELSMLDAAVIEFWGMRP